MTYHEILGATSAAQQIVGVLALAQQIVFFALMTVCTYTDIAKDRVYNWVTLPAIFVGLGLWFMSYGTDKPFIYAVAAAAVGGGVFFIVFLFRAVGAGDVKLMAAVGALMGWKFTLVALFPIGIVGAVMAVGVLIYRKQVFRGLKSSAKLMVTFKKSKPPEGEKPITIP